MKNNNKAPVSIHHERTQGLFKLNFEPTDISRHCIHIYGYFNYHGRYEYIWTKVSASSALSMTLIDKEKVYTEMFGAQAEYYE